MHSRKHDLKININLTNISCILIFNTFCKAKINNTKTLQKQFKIKKKIQNNIKKKKFCLLHLHSMKRIYC